MRCISPIEVWPDGKRHVVACGKCLACLTSKRQSWIFRLTQEHKASKGALFITLTYHPKYCPDQLEKSHLQKFMKRLRKRESDRIRYYAVGEYGSDYGRPHYHILLFNCDLTGRTIRQSWPYGIVHIGNVTAASVAYVTKYVVQPENVEEKKQKPFALMSRGYGLGLSYLTDSMVVWHRADDRTYAVVNGQQVKLPRYYHSKIWYRDRDKKRVADKSKWKAVKAQRDELRWFVKEYGVENAKMKLAEFRNAQILRIKTKVAYTQKLK